MLVWSLVSHIYRLTGDKKRAIEALNTADELVKRDAEFDLAPLRRFLLLSVQDQDPRYAAELDREIDKIAGENAYESKVYRVLKEIYADRHQESYQRIDELYKDYPNNLQAMISPKFVMPEISGEFL